jgi:hypothetical protein
MQRLFEGTTLGFVGIYLAPAPNRHQPVDAGGGPGAHY